MIFIELITYLKNSQFVISDTETCKIDTQSWNATNTKPYLSKLYGYNFSSNSRIHQAPQEKAGLS